MTEQVEEWRDVKDYEGYYQVSDQGRIKSRDRVIKVKNRAPYILKGRYIQAKARAVGNYCNLALHKEGRGTNKYLHRLVAEVFITNDCQDPKAQVNHKDGNKLNNTVTNLEWVTPRENHLHARDTLKVMEAGSNPNKIRILLPEDIHIIFRMRKEGHALKTIGETVGTHFSNVSQILLGKTWKKYSEEQGLSLHD